MLTDTLYNPQPVIDDSLLIVAKNLTGTVESYDVKLDSLASRLDTIAEYGVGYSDMAGHIALPLIIALFAFSFPFIFDTINHINNKYSSCVISDLFTKSCRYRLFWLMNVMGVLVAITYGGCSLLLDGESHATVLDLSWILLVVAFLYSASVLSFALFCVHFNKPMSLIRIISRRYNFECRKEHFHVLMWDVRKWIKSKTHRINDGNKRIYSMFRNMSDSFSNTGVEYLRIDRLAALCKYSLLKNDMTLFDEIIYEISKITDKERNRYADDAKFIISANHPYCSSRFFCQVYAFYATLPENAHVEDRLVRYRLYTFSKRRLVSVPGLNWLVSSMMRMADSKHFSLVSRYIQDSSWYYRFVNRLAQSVYVQGGTNDDRIKAESKSWKNWDDVCNYHFFMMAYVFAKGGYGLLKDVFEHSNSYTETPYPYYCTKILVRYLKCRKELDSSGKFEIYDTVDNIHRNIDSDQLDRYAAALMLIAKMEDVGIAEILTADLQRQLSECWDNLKRGFEYNQYNQEFISLFPTAKNDKYEEIFNQSKDYLSVDSAKKLYEGELSEEVRNSLNNYMLHIQDTIKRNISKVVSGNESCEREEIMVNDCPVITSRLLFTNPDQGWTGSVTQFIGETVSARVLYIIMTILSKKKTKERKSTPVQFNRVLNKITGGKTDQYVLLDFDSGFHAILLPEIKGFRSYEYKGYDYYRFDELISSLGETEMFDKLKDGLWVVEKCLLPVLKRADENKLPSVIVSDESSLEKGNLNVRIIAYPNIKVCYKKGGTIYKIKPMKEKL